MKKLDLKMLIIAFTAVLLLAGCGKSDAEVTYEVVNGEIVEIHNDAQQSTEKDKKEKKSKKEKENKSSSKNKSGDSGTGTIDNEQIFSDESATDSETSGESTLNSSENQNTGTKTDAYQPGEQAYDGKDDVEGTAVTIIQGNGDYNSIAAESDVRIKKLENELEHAVEACQEIYNNADKGEGINVTLSSSTVAEMITAIGNAGYSAIDSNNEFNMQCYEPMDEFGKSISGHGNISGTYFVLYSDGHMSAYDLYREDNQWHLLAMSSKIEEFKVYQDSKGRYTVDEIKYTDRGWLIYKRNTDTTYNMIKVTPVDSYAKQLCERYVEPVGYLENNLFTVTWDENNFGPVDFNSLYAYIFGMYNGTEMLSSYNVRNYYKAYGGTRIYIVPTDIFENNVTTYFSIDPDVLKSISDYSYSLGGYMFLGYNRDYYNVAPKTPEPEVIDYKTNSDGSITMTVAAVSKWYGTDSAFKHILTVYPNGNSFKYISNTLIEDENNIIPEHKLAAMLDVERAKSDY